MAAGGVLLAVLCRIPSSASDLAARNSEVASVVLRLERSKFRALEQKDTGVLNVLFDDALMLVDFNGDLLTKAAYLQGLHDAIPLRAVPESMTVTAFGRVAIVFGIYEVTGMKGGHAYHRRLRFVDTWQYNDGRWVCIAMTASSAIA